jgi:hypothetical protein
MKNMAIEMAKEFKRYEALEYKYGAEGNDEKVDYYQKKKWDTKKAAEQENIAKEFSAALSELGGIRR